MTYSYCIRLPRSRQDHSDDETNEIDSFLDTWVSSVHSSRMDTEQAQELRVQWDMRLAALYDTDDQSGFPMPGGVS